MYITSYPSSNFTKGPFEMKGVMLHMTLGNLQSSLNTLTNPDNEVSCHFVISREGEIFQLVSTTDMAWHGGYIYNPSERFTKIALRKRWRSFVNPNKYLIGIEFIAGYDVDLDGVVEPNEKLWTEKQMASATELVQGLLEMDDPDWIITHRDGASYKPNLELWRNELLKRMASAPPLVDLDDTSTATGPVDREKTKEKIINLVKLL